MTVEILLAAYNGEKYIAKQLDSILNQSFENWHLTARDDCSRDNTYNILKMYKNKHPNKITVYKAEKNSGNAKDNFFWLLNNVSADYIMFCDQDDVWLENKIEDTLSAMIENEENCLPVLVHTDLRVADENLNVVSKSMFKSQKLNYKKTKPNNIVAQNIVTGCTVMINKYLADLLKTKPNSVPVHDWWIALTASVFGKIVFLSEPAILYRQHGLNQCGAQNMHSSTYVKNRAVDGKKAAYMLKLGYDMAKEFVLIYGNKLDEKTLNMLTHYGSMPEFNYIQKLFTLIRFKIWKNGFVRIIGQLTYM